VFFPEKHFGVLAEREASGLIIIFRRNRQHDARVSQREKISLEIEKGLSGRVSLGDLDSGQTVVADDSTPQSVIEIQNQTATALSSHGRNRAADIVSVEWDASLRELKFGKVPS
jgi:hypothetical protein